jgi:nitrate/TMAO reductase-like tetraheme cytochrome c subunit
MSERHRMGIRLVDLFAWSGATLLLACGLACEAVAATSSPAAVFTEECGACHVAYPGNLMQASDWSKVLGSLDRHYGVDASLDPQALAVVANHLKATAAATKAVDKSQTLPRITTSSWFRNEHDEVSAKTWSSPAVKSAANCAACHPGAERGNFDEHSIRIPSEGRHEHDRKD